MNDLWNSIARFFGEMFPTATQQAATINTLFIQFLIVAAIIILIVSGAIFYAAIRYRAAKHTGEPPQIYGNKKLEISWTVIPFLLLLSFFYLSVKAMKDINQPFGDKKADIRIIAHQWWWDIRFPAYHIITANELHIPTGERLLMEIESADVIHSWWVPQLGRKIDALPGRHNYNWIEADTSGEYLGKCSEYCGAQHAWMLIRVVAEPQDKFNQWLKLNQSPATSVADNISREGAAIFQQKACAGCHAIQGTDASSHLAPDLTHMASRKTLLSGMLSNNKRNLRNWLKNPQKIKPGAHMPNFMLSKRELDALTAYLEGLR